MNPNEAIAELKRYGLVVHVMHLRFPDNDETRGLAKEKHYEPLDGYLLYPKWQMRERGLAVFPKGGRTIVTIKEDGTEIASGVSYCNLLDDFNPKVGLTKALGRALSALTHQVPA